MASIGAAPHVGLKSAYERDGWCEPPYRFGDAAVALLRERTLAISRERRPEVVHEKDGGTVRAIHGCHAFDEVCAALVRHPYLVELAEELIGGPVYVYQFKVNLKQAHEGAAWPWHQDFAFWHEEDGMRRPDAVNIAISLDDVHEDNGPLMAIPGSHRLGLLDLPEGRADGTESDWRSHVSADLAYTVDADRAGALAEESGRKLFVGPRGSVQVFHPSIVHSSSNNVSADRRALLLITYNAVANAPVRPTRPAFLVSRDTTPVTPRADERLALQALPDPTVSL
ncbi:phytanoyl-CoA dioxygenase family protein [Streptomyces naphthomycinicus]|uniref:phytanoyl-CoA dioxygenase family protein n=1 Tax=Streptomyces naphthomycinicus TaxID=2872625 RepID=UPI001CECB109|nr:phytanoyl-CoA dioxygenase family protein [Streptomyces sp. TML10]